MSLILSSAVVVDLQADIEAIRRQAYAVEAIEIAREAARANGTPMTEWDCITCGLRVSAPEGVEPICVCCGEAMVEVRRP